MLCVINICLSTFSGSGSCAGSMKSVCAPRCTFHVDASTDPDTHPWAAEAGGCVEEREGMIVPGGGHCGLCFGHTAAVQPGLSPWVVFLAPVAIGAVRLSCTHGYRAREVSGRDGSRLALAQFPKTLLVAWVDSGVSMLRTVPVVCN